MKQRNKKQIALSWVLVLTLLASSFSGMLFTSKAAEEEYVEYTFSDIGIVDGTYTENKFGTLNITSFDKVAFTGEITFSNGGTSGGRLGIVPNEGNWSGLMFCILYEGLYIQNFLSSSDFELKSYNLGMTSPDELTSKAMKLRIAFDKASDTETTVTVTVNDKYSTTKNVPTELLESCKTIVVNGTADYPITVKSVERQYDKYTFSDVGLENGSYSAYTAKKINIDTLDGVSFIGQINYSEICYNTGFGFCTSGSSTGFRYIYWDNAIIIEDYTGSGQTTYISAADLGLSSGSLIADRDWTIKTTFDKRGNDMQVRVTVNDIVTKTLTFPADKLETYNYVFATGTDTVPANIQSVKKTYTEYTFKDVNIPDGTYTTNQFGTLDISSFNEVSFTGNFLFSNGGESCGFGFVPSQGNFSGLKFIIANGNALYLQNYLVSGGTGDREFKYDELGYETVEEMLTQPIKIKVDFNKKGTDMTVTITVNDKVTKMVAVPADDMNKCTTVLVQATENLPMSVASKESTDTPEEPNVPLEATFDSFGMEANQIFKTTMNSIKVPNNAETLDNINFTGYLKYAKQGESDCFSYGVNESGKGIDFFWSGDSVWVYDKTGGYTNAQGNSCIVGVGKDAIGVDSADCEVKVQISTVYVGDDVNLTIYIGDYQHEIELKGYASYMGTGISVKSTTGVIAYRSTVYEEFDAANQLEAEGYQCLHVTDFGALEYKTYDAETESSTSGDYSGDSLDMTYLDLNLRYSDFAATSYIAYGSKDGWSGLQLQYAPSANLFVLVQEKALETYLAPAEVGMTAYSDQFNVKIATKICKTAEGKDAYQVNVWFNNIQVVKDALLMSGDIGKRLVIYTPDTNKIEIVAPKITEVKQTATAYSLRGYDQITLQSYFVAGNVTVKKGNEDVTVSEHKLTMPGDYTIITEVSSTAHRYVQDVALYILGDVDLDGVVGTKSDVETLQKLIQDKPYRPTKAAEYAADIDNNGTVDKKDLTLLKSVEGDEDKLVTLLKKYYVPSKSYEYLGGNDVMPIVGYYGPYVSNEKDYLTDEIYSLIKNSGVNMVNHSINDANGGISLIRKAMTLADKYKIGWFVDDAGLNESMTNAELSSTLGRYSYFESFLGTHIVDEPSYKDATDNPRPLEDYTGLSDKLNAFTNITGFVNMVAEDATTVNKYSSWVSSYKKTDYYDEYWDQYMKNANPQVISSDDYPFNNGLSEDATSAGGYFRTLGKIRLVSLDNNVPFWSYVQAGGNFDNDTDTTNSNLVATEAETYWNVNTALAFGAKGIEWFPLIQPTNFDGTDAANPIDRNGILLSDGTKSGRYDWVVNANKQIAAVDDVLMKATSTAIVASGGYAESQAKGQAKGDNNKTITTTEILKKHGKLSSVSSTSTDYGALVGCFSYRDTEAFYVVNYDVTKEATITLTFDDTYHVRIVQNGESKCGSMSGTTITLTLDAGKGALVVLENADDQQCYYKKVTTASGDVYQCVHAEGNAGGANYGTAIVYGNLNNDADVDIKDIVRMKKILANKEETIYAGMADMNADYTIDKTDTDVLRRYIIGKKEELI